MKLTKRQLTIFKLIAIVAIIILAIILSKIILDNELAQKEVEKYGYFGAFILSIVSGFNLIVPIPAISFLPILTAAGLNQWIIIFIISVGITIADASAYFFGRVGRETFKKYSETRVARFKDIYKNHHWTAPATLFLFAVFIPLPNELLIVPLAFLGCRLKEVLPAVFLGNLAFNSISAWGILSLTNFF